MKVLYLSTYLVLLILIFFGLPDVVTYSKGFIRWLPFILIFFLQTFLLYKVLSRFNVPKKIKQLITAISIIIIEPLFGIYSESKLNADLAKHGVKTNGIIYKKWLSNGNKGEEWLVRCNYSVNNQTYSTFSMADKLIQRRNTITYL